MKRAAVLIGLVLAACAPAHLRAIGLDGGGRDLPDLFLGGWDGKKLHAFDGTNDFFVTPGETTRPELVRVLGHLASDRYAVVYVESSKLDAASAKAHGIFCDTPWCLVVLDRKGQGSFEKWGDALAVFELSGPGDGPIGNVWIAGREVRPPGPTTWLHRCLNKEDTPKFVHPDGGALYPARDGSDGIHFALFGPRQLPDEYQQSGFDAPSDTICDEEMVKLSKDKLPPPPKLHIDPSLLGNPDSAGKK